MSADWFVSYDPVVDEYVLSDGRRISRFAVMNMCNPYMIPNPTLGSGEIDGRYRSTTTPTHSNTADGTDPGHTGTQACTTYPYQASLQAAVQAAIAQQAALINAGFTPPWVSDYDLLKGLPHAGIKAGEIIAYRCWRLIGGALHSAVWDAVWIPGKAMEGNLKIPGGGVYSWKDEKSAWNYGNDCLIPYQTLIFGKVKLWGEVIEFEKGYRAEKAKIVSLDKSSYRRGEELLQAIRKRYGVEEAHDGA